MRGVAQRTEIEHARDRQPRRYLGMIKNERCQMPARGPAGDDDRPLDAVLAGRGVEPVERAFQLVGDLRQGRLRRQRVTAQSRRPTTCQRTLGEAGKDLLAAALPIAAVDVNEAWRLRIIGRIKVPLIAFSVSISQVEMLRTLLAQRLRSCGPAFGFLAGVLGAYMLDIVICKIAVLKRHCNPVHAGSGAFLRASSWCRNASGICRHEGATTKRCHIGLPGLLELGGGQAKMCNNIADRVPPTLVLLPKCVNLLRYYKDNWRASPPSRSSGTCPCCA